MHYFFEKTRIVIRHFTPRSAFDLLSFRFEGMHLAAYILGASALASSLLGLLRDRLLAHIFGAGAELDLYYAAFRVPDILFVGLGALVSAFVLIPELKKRTEEEQRRYFDSIIGAFGLLGIVASLLAAICAPLILQWLFPALAEGESFALLVLLTRIMLIQPVLLGLSNVYGAVTQARHRYALFAASALLYNVGIIGGILFFYPLFGLSGLAWGVVLGASLHLALQFFSVAQDGFLGRLPRRRDMRVLISTARISTPRAAALSMNQLSFLGLTSLAGTLASGSIAVFSLAYNLQAVPLAMIGAAYSVAAFPVLAERAARGEMQGFIAQVGAAARHVLFWSLPALALILVLRAHIVRIVLGTGSFDWTDTRLTAASLALFALSLASQGLSLLLLRAYYAAGKTWVPFGVSAIAALSTIALGALSLGLFHVPFLSDFLEALFRVDGLPGSSVLALPFALSVGSLISTLVLFVHFEKTIGPLFSSIRDTLRQAVVAAACGGMGAYALLTFLGPLSLSSTSVSVLLKGASAGLFGVFVSALAYRLLRSGEYAEVSAAFRRRMWREARVTGSAEESEIAP